MTGKTRLTPAERRRVITETAYFMTHGRGLAGEPASSSMKAFRSVDRRLGASAKSQVERLETRVATTTEKLSALKRRGSTLAIGARTELSAYVKTLDALKRSLRHQLDELRKRSDQVSEKALHQAENLWNELSDALQRVAATAQR